jgi:hypothetical protein
MVADTERLGLYDTDPAEVTAALKPPATHRRADQASSAHGPAPASSYRAEPATSCSRPPPQASTGLYGAERSLPNFDRTLRLLQAKRDIAPEETDAYLVRLFRQMETSFPDALVTDWESLVDTVQLPDPDDRHVVAAARAGRADVIVTDNLADFPPGALPVPLAGLGRSGHNRSPHVAAGGRGSTGRSGALASISGSFVQITVPSGDVGGLRADPFQAGIG